MHPMPEWDRVKNDTREIWVNLKFIMNKFSQHFMRNNDRTETEGLTHRKMAARQLVLTGTDLGERYTFRASGSRQRIENRLDKYI